MLGHLSPFSHLSDRLESWVSLFSDSGSKFLQRRAGLVECTDPDTLETDAEGLEL